MKIELGLTQDFLYQSGYSLKDQNKMTHEKYAFCFREMNQWDIEPVEDKIKHIRMMINNKFKSIFWKKTDWGWTFSFKDQADEAFFLVWASEGIDI